MRIRYLSVVVAAMLLGAGGCDDDDDDGGLVDNGGVIDNGGTTGGTGGAGGAGGTTGGVTAGGTTTGGDGTTTGTGGGTTGGVTTGGNGTTTGTGGTGGGGTGGATTGTGGGTATGTGGGTGVGGAGGAITGGAGGGTGNGGNAGGGADACVAPSAINPVSEQTLMVDDVPAPGATPDPAYLVDSDAEIAGVVKAINDAEVLEGRLAVTNAQDPRVRSYARLMILAHNRATQEKGVILRRLGIEWEESELRQELTAEAEDVMQTLRNACGEDFDDVYMASQVTGHREAVEVLNALIAQTENEEMRALLVAVRFAALEHLEAAIDLQATLRGQSTAGGPTGSPTTPASGG